MKPISAGIILTGCLLAWGFLCVYATILLGSRTDDNNWTPIMVRLYMDPSKLGVFAIVFLLPFSIPSSLYAIWKQTQED